MKLRTAGPLALAVALLCAVAAHATTMRKLDLDALVSTADVIALATAGPGESAAVGRRFVTRTPLIAERIIKGAVDGPIVVETPGGSIDGIGQRVAGSARFAEGEQVIVFLTRLDGDRYRVRGMAQGKLRVVPGVAGGRVVRDLSGLALVTDGAPVEGAVDQLPLDGFLKDLAVRIARDAQPLDEPATVVPSVGAPTVAPEGAR